MPDELKKALQDAGLDKLLSGTSASEVFAPNCDNSCEVSCMNGCSAGCPPSNQKGSGS